jgi:SNF2 family DNA or RNA helicase
MGQKNKVIIYKLITEGTIEEKILELQEEKRNLLNQIVNADSATEKTIDMHEIEKVLLT